MLWDATTALHRAGAEWKADSLQCLRSAATESFEEIVLESDPILDENQSNFFYHFKNVDRLLENLSFTFHKTALARS